MGSYQGCRPSRMRDRAKNSATQRLRLLRRKQARLCASCASPRILSGITCVACAAKSRKASLSYYYSHRNECLARGKAWRNKNRSRVNLRDRIRRARDNRVALSRRRLSEQRKQAGLCICKRPLVPGQGKCEACRTAHRRRCRAYYRRHPERVNARSAQWAANNRERMTMWRRAYSRTAPRRQYALEYARRHYKDPQWIARNRLRSRIAKLLKLASATSNHRTSALVGCTAAHLVAHLQSQFVPGMNWENRNLWHIDHIRPCAAFDLTNPAQQRECFHFTNLRPLWSIDNLRLGGRVRRTKYAGLPTEQSIVESTVSA